ncbi:MAG: YggS family pyridoxal phosphate-dependent enzyme [Paludibacter sp.]|jgi:pyridoxal phosphate enzyme (YggS family)
MSVTQNIQRLRSQIPENVQLICVTKFHSDEIIMEAYNAGEKTFGESRVQEFLPKRERLPKDIHWHFIGHLQTNKVKYLIPGINLIHGVDSIRLLKTINNQAQKSDCVVNCLLQVYIADEQTKFGFSPDELTALFETDFLKAYPNVSICGLMGMATFTDDHNQVRKEFKSLKKLFDTIKQNYQSDNPNFKELSMGMSDDYQIAIEEGSTMIRVGTLIFGEREY